MTRNVDEVLDDLAAYLKLDGQEGQSRMYGRAADNIRLAGSIPPNPAEIDGIGDKLRDDVAEIQATGTHERLEKLKEAHPYYEAFRDIQGIGPVLARAIASEGIETKAELRDAIESGAINDVQGIGPATAEKIADNL